MIVRKRGGCVYQGQMILTPKDILEKEFKIDTRGYRPQEVDKFLDLVIKDYEEFYTLLKDNESEKKELIDDNIKLKQEIRNLRTKLDIVKNTSTTEGISNADLLRRLSNLEKIIYGKE